MYPDQLSDDEVPNTAYIPVVLSCIVKKQFVDVVVDGAGVYDGASHVPEKPVAGPFT